MEWIFISMMVIPLLIVVMIQRAELKLLRKEHNEVPIKKDKPLLKKGTFGIAEYKVPTSFYTNGNVSEGHSTVRAKVKLDRVFGDLASVEVIEVYGHKSKLAALNYLKRLNYDVRVSLVRWETGNEVLKLGDDDILALHQNKYLCVGGVEIEYTGDLTPIEMIDKLIV